jgi:hypothetical protein
MPVQVGELKQNEMIVSYEDFTIWVKRGAVQLQRKRLAVLLLFLQTSEEVFQKQNQRVSFRFAEIASWRVRGRSRHRD